MSDSVPDTDRDSLAPAQPGDVLLGKYRVDRVLGAGGMGVVVAATHIDLEERVAIKFLRDEVLHNEEALERFLREARAAVRIKSEHVARVIDVGRLDTGAPYMVLEYLEGADLSEVLEQADTPIEEAVDYLIQACDAMAEAHAAGIVHRDLKPANLFRTERSDGSHLIKVLDFGISKVTTPTMAQASLTGTSAAIGSPLYMSPEQMRSSKNVDLRSDIWSLGVILFELITRRTPFSASTFPELCAAVLGDDPRSLKALRPEAPDGLDAVVRQCLEKDPALRFKSVAELAKALLPFAPEHSHAVVARIGKILTRAGMPSFHDMKATVPTRPGASADTVASLGEAATGSAWSGTQKREVPPKRRRGLYLGLGAGALITGGIAYAAIQSLRAAPGPAPEPATQAETIPQKPESLKTIPITPTAKEPTRPETAPTTTSSAAPTPEVRKPSTRTGSVTQAKPTKKPSKTIPPANTTKTTSKTSAAPTNEPTEKAPAPQPTATKSPPKNPLDIGLK